MELNPILNEFGAILNGSCTSLTVSKIVEYLNTRGPATQAVALGKQLMICSRVRSLSVTRIRDFVQTSAHVECEYLSMKKAYVTKFKFTISDIIESSCTCIASNRTTGHCKHESAVLWALHILQNLSRFSESPPKYLQRNGSTKKWLKDERPGRQKVWHFWPWKQTLNTLLSPIDSKLVLQSTFTVPPRPGRRTTPTQDSTSNSTSTQVLSQPSNSSASIPSTPFSHLVIGTATPIPITTGMPAPAPSPIATSTSTPIQIPASTATPIPAPTTPSFGTNLSLFDPVVSSSQPNTTTINTTTTTTPTIATPRATSATSPLSAVPVAAARRKRTNISTVTLGPSRSAQVEQISRQANENPFAPRAKRQRIRSMRSLGL